MDNASIHKRLNLQTTPVICHTPPYSPIYNFIELCFGIIKNNFKKQNCTTNVNNENLIEDCISSLSSESILNRKAGGPLARGGATVLNMFMIIIL